MADPKATTNDREPTYAMRSRWIRGIVALLRSDNLAQAARRAKVSQSTLRSWLRHPEFRAGYEEARRDLLAESVRIVAIEATETPKGKPDPVEALTDLNIERPKGADCPQPNQSNPE